MTVFVLQHVHTLDDGSEDVKFIGVYSSREAASATQDRIGKAYGFSSATSGFHVDEYQVDKDHWVDGFDASETNDVSQPQ